MVLSWGIVILGAGAQPLFADVTTAAVPLPSGEGLIPVAVGDVAKYEQGYRFYLDPASEDPTMLLITSIDEDNNILYCQSEGEAKTKPYPSGTVMMLSVPAATINVQPLTGIVYLGKDGNITNVPTGNIYKKIDSADGQSPEFSIGYNIIRTSDYWIVGTSGTQVIVGATVA